MSYFNLPPGTTIDDIDESWWDLVAYAIEHELERRKIRDYSWDRISILFGRLDPDLSPLEIAYQIANILEEDQE